MRILGIDYGERRIGLALSDPTGTLASPLRTLVYRLGKRPPVALMERVARDEDVEQIVIGLPLDPSGAETTRCQNVREMGKRLGQSLGIPVVYVDERLSSVDAVQKIRRSGLPRGKRHQKERVDAAAAAIILQRWLDGVASR